MIVEQTKALKTLSNKNMFHPELLENYQRSFLKLTDKSVVKACLMDFLQINSLIGHSAGIDPLKLTQTIRRVIKSPEEWSITDMLNFCLILADTNANFEDFDQKSKDYVMVVLDKIEQHFQGYHHLDCGKQQEEDQKVRLNIFGTIQTDNKTFSKQ